MYFVSNDKNKAVQSIIDLLDTSVIVFVNDSLWFVFHFMLFA